MNRKLSQIRVRHISRRNARASRRAVAALLYLKLETRKAKTVQPVARPAFTVVLVVQIVFMIMKHFKQLHISHFRSKVQWIVIDTQWYVIDKFCVKTE